MFYLKTRTRSSNKLDEVRLCFRQDAESWYDINKTHWDTLRCFGRGSWSVSRRVSAGRTGTKISRPTSSIQAEVLVDFFLGRLSIARSLMLPHALGDLMRLFPDEIRLTWNTVPRTMRTVKATQHFLIDKQATKDLDSYERSSVRPKRVPGAPAYQRREARDTQFPAPTSFALDGSQPLLHSPVKRFGKRQPDILVRQACPSISSKPSNFVNIDSGPFRNLGKKFRSIFRSYLYINTYSNASVERAFSIINIIKKKQIKESAVKPAKKRFKFVFGKKWDYL